MPNKSLIGTLYPGRLGSRFMFLAILIVLMPLYWFLAASLAILGACFAPLLNVPRVTFFTAWIYSCVAPVMSVMAFLGLIFMGALIPGFGDVEIPETLFGITLVVFLCLGLFASFWIALKNEYHRQKTQPAPERQMWETQGGGGGVYVKDRENG